MAGGSRETHELGKAAPLNPCVELLLKCILGGSRDLGSTSASVLGYSLPITGVTTRKQYWGGGMISVVLSSAISSY